MDPVGVYRSELTGVGVDAADRYPAGDALGSADDALTGEADGHLGRGDAHVDEPLREHVGDLAGAEVVVDELPEIADAHDAFVVDAHPGAVVELVDSGRHIPDCGRGMILARASATTAERHRIRRHREAGEIDSHLAILLARPRRG